MLSSEFTSVVACKMASALVVCVISALAAQGAVLDTQDTLLRRIVRSPGCDKCSEHPQPPPPPPPPPFRRGPPPSLPRLQFGSASSQASSFKETDFSRNQHVGKSQQNTFNSGSSASAQAVAGQYDKSHKDGFSGNQQLGGVQQNEINAQSSASAHAVSGIAGSSHDSKNGFPRNQQHFGNGVQKGFNGGSSASAQAVSGIGGGFDKHSAKYGAGKQDGHGLQRNGLNTGSAASAETARGVAGSYDKFAHKEEFSGKQQALEFQQNGQAVGGAFENLKQASNLKDDKQACSSCAKGGSAVSNAKSHSGSATAIAVNNG